MKILVMGAGAVGGYFGGMLTRSGQDVTFVARGRQLQAIASGGLRVQSASVGKFTVYPQAEERPDGTWKADLVLYCVKGYHNEQAIEPMRPAVGRDTAILTLQNGVGSGDLLARAYGQDKVMLGAAYIETARTEPGAIVQTGPCRIVFGELDRRQRQRAVGVRDALRSAGVDVDLADDVVKEVWNKLIMVCGLSGMTCATRASFAEVFDTPATRDLTRDVMREATAVARAKGVDIEDDIVESAMDYFLRNKTEMTSSMYFDLVSGNPLELNVLNGAVSRAGKEMGVATPLNDFITACLTVADYKARAGRGLATGS